MPGELLEDSLFSFIEYIGDGLLHKMNECSKPPVVLKVTNPHLGETASSLRKHIKFVTERRLRDHF